MDGTPCIPQCMKDVARFLSVHLGESSAHHLLSISNAMINDKASSISFVERFARVRVLRSLPWLGKFPLYASNLLFRLAAAGSGLQEETSFTTRRHS